jgi:hypothetical protein
MTGLCPDVQIEISKYLTLDDTINAFSISILPYLRQAHTKVHLVDAPNPFLQIIAEHLDRNQISSVRIRVNPWRPYHFLEKNFLSSATLWKRWKVAEKHFWS